MYFNVKVIHDILDQQEDANKKWYNHVKTCSLDLAEEIANKYSSITKIIIKKRRKSMNTRVSCEISVGAQ